MKARIIAHNVIRCKKCGDILESFSVHDFKMCSCGNCAVDGGHNYLRRCGELDDWEDLSTFIEKEVVPKYKVGDCVIFTYPIDAFELKGKITSVDTYLYSMAIEYDIMLLSEEHLFKGIDEKHIVGIIPPPE